MTLSLPMAHYAARSRPIARNPACAAAFAGIGVLGGLPQASGNAEPPGTAIVAQRKKRGILGFPCIVCWLERAAGATIAR